MTDARYFHVIFAPDYSSDLRRREFPLHAAVTDAYGRVTLLSEFDITPTIFALDRDESFGTSSEPAPAGSDTHLGKPRAVLRKRSRRKVAPLRPGLVFRPPSRGDGCGRQGGPVIGGGIVSQLRDKLKILSLDRPRVSLPVRLV